MAGAAVVLLSRLFTFPRTPWELDEFLFLHAVRDYEPLLHHPHPPGYPLYPGLGKAVNLIVGSPFAALVIISIVSAVITFLALERAFRIWSDETTATTGALLFTLSAGMLIHSSLALADSLALACFAIAFAALAEPREHLTDTHALFAGVAASFAIGARPQLAVPLLPALTVGLVVLRTWRQRSIATAAFTLASLIWFVPLVVETGGWDGFVRYQIDQARYVAAHDAAISRGAKSLLRVAVRFTARAWGSNIVIVLVAVLSLVGLVPWIRRWRLSMLPFVQFAVLHLLFAIAVMDPADAVRYSLPSMPFVAFLIALGLQFLARLTQVRALPWTGMAIIVALSIWYAAPILIDRTTSASPVADAAEAIRSRYPKETIVLYQAGMRPHLEWLLPEYPKRHVEDAMREVAASLDKEVVLVVEGHVPDKDARVFSWRESEAFAKMTRTFGRQVSVDPLAREERFVPLEGVYALEGAPDHTPWRWLARAARIRVPDIGKELLILRLGLVPEAPYEKARVAVYAGRRRYPVEVTKTTPALVVVRPHGIPEIRIASADSFRPADVLGNQDRRVLSVQLLGMEQR
jgi:hypothetical protein